jgi:hypothetical protein
MLGSYHTFRKSSAAAIQQIAVIVLVFGASRGVYGGFLRSSFHLATSIAVKYIFQMIVFMQKSASIVVRMIRRG